MNRPTNPELIEDVQSSADKRHLDIDQVGIRAIKHPVIVKDKKGGVQHTVANFNMYVHLPHNFKGTHMSRFVEILNENEDAISVESFENILKQMLVRLESESCDVEMTFPYFVNKEAPVSKVQSLLYYVTEKAYDNPKFVEDMVRDIATELKAHKKINSFIVESENFESIHNHSAYALIKG